MKFLYTASISLLVACAGPQDQVPSPGPIRPAPPAPPINPVPRKSPSTRAFPFTLLLRGWGGPIPCRVKDTAKEEVRLEVERRRFSLVVRGESPGRPYPDVLLPRGRDRILRCRIEKEAEDLLTVTVPLEEVAALTFEGEGSSPPAGPPPSREEKTGGFRGVVILGNRPLAGARVRAVQLTGRSILPGLLEAPPKLDRPVETRTDQEGRFSFQDLPPGNYKLWVQPPGRRDWIRRIRMVPDVRVTAGKTVEMKPFRIRTVLGS